MTKAPAYLVLTTAASAEIEVLGSRFIADLGLAETSAHAQAFLQSIRQRYPDATHHCFAFVVGPAGSSRDVGFSDDGEPHNTAGRPMLQVLSHSGVGDIVAVVTRYFGGTKLGRGGLVRAYSSAVQQALQLAQTELKVDWVYFEVTTDYAQAPALQRLYPDHHAELLKQSYAESVVQKIRVPKDRASDLRRAVTDATRGEVELKEEQ